MGLFDDDRPSYVEVRHHSHSHSKDNHNRGFSPERSSTSKGYFVRPHVSSRSNSSSFFSRGFGFGGSGSSSYRRSPRSGYITHLWNKLRRMLRELWAYARRHPMKAFFAVVVPLVSAGGAIHGLMRQFGVRIPGLEGLGGGRSMGGRGGGGYYGSSGYGGLGGGGGMGGAGAWMNNAGSLMQIAKAFV